MKIASMIASLLAGLLMSRSSAFVAPPQINSRRGGTVSSTQKHNPSPTQLEAALSPGDYVMLIGPGFLQLVVAKTLKQAGLRPIVCAPQTKLDSFEKLVNDGEIMKDSTIGMPEVGEDQFGKLAAVVVCSENAVITDEVLLRVLDYKDKGQSPWVEGGLKKAICCAPVSEKVQKVKSMGWIPIFNNDAKDDNIWKELVNTFKSHPVSKVAEGKSSVIRHGSLLGGSVDGPECIKHVGIDEGMYKMSLEQYRDLIERAFDRYRLGTQLLQGDSINLKPPNQEKMEKEAFKKNEASKETFTVVDGYPEVDRSNRHSVAQAIAQVLLRDDGATPSEFTVLSKAIGNFQTDAEWDEMFKNPQPAKWPDPYAFEPEKFGVEA
uniref:Uncharacterized protein n=1 Tax=Grammatophora oceanica TaxID=210454 RepID=A0A7S1VTJ8_9STRA|mmetsp:Transcript_5727/g.8104  ORF Transcript_5727/g.8104 Transcript_5727/m.8104 type:complete len:377 (+) Transcript_5727:89-1219(+)